MQEGSFDEKLKFKPNSHLKLQLPAETATSNKIDKIRDGSMSFEKDFYHVEVQEPTFEQNVFIQSVSINHNESKMFFSNN